MIDFSGVAAEPRPTLPETAAARASVPETFINTPVAPPGLDSLFELQLRVAQRADELALCPKFPTTLNLLCWLQAEEEILGLFRNLPSGLLWGGGAPRATLARGVAKFIKAETQNQPLGETGTAALGVGERRRWLFAPTLGWET